MFPRDPHLWRAGTGARMRQRKKWGRPDTGSSEQTPRGAPCTPLLTYPRTPQRHFQTTHVVLIKYVPR